MTEERELKLDHFKLPEDSPLFGTFINDLVEQILVDIVYDQTDKTIPYYELLNEVGKFKTKKEKANVLSIKKYISRLTHENVEKALASSLKLKMKLNSRNRNESLISLENVQAPSQMPSDLVANENVAKRMNGIANRLTVINFLYREDVEESAIKGQWSRPRKGKKQGGLVQRDGQTAQAIVDNYGSFFTYLIRSYPIVKGKSCVYVDEKTRMEQKRLETHLLGILKQRLEGRITHSFGIIPVLDVLYNFFDQSPRMIDEAFLRAAIDKHFNDKYEIVHGYIQLRHSTIGMKSNLNMMRIDQSIRSKTAAITGSVDTIVPGDEHSLAVKEDNKYLRVGVAMDIDVKYEKKNIILDKVEEKMDSGDGFFTGGGIPGFDEDNTDDADEMKKRNRSQDVQIDDLGAEFRELCEKEELQALPFVDSLIEDVKNNSSTDAGTFYDRAIHDIFSNLFAETLKMSSQTKSIKFPITMDAFRDHMCSYYPCVEANMEKNSHFMSKTLFEKFVQAAIDERNDLMLKAEWEQPNLVIKQKIDPRARSGRRNDLARIEGISFFDEDEIKPNIRTITNEPILPDKRRDWRKVSEIVAEIIENRFKDNTYRRDPVPSGVHHFNEEANENTLVAHIIAKGMRKGDLKENEVESAFWKIVLGIEEGVIKNNGFLMPFSFIEQTPKSGVDFIQYIDRSDSNAEDEISTWRATCPLPNGQELYSKIKSKMERIFKTSRSSPVDTLVCQMIRDSDVSNCLKILTPPTFELVELPLTTRTILCERVVSIVATQERELFKFEGLDVYKVTEKRKRERVESPVEAVPDNCRKVTTMIDSVKNLGKECELSADAQKLLNHFMKQNEHKLKKEEMETRPTKQMELSDIFRSAFRFNLIQNGMFQAIGWSIIAEIVLARTIGNSGKSCRLIEIATLYPHYRDTVIKDIEEKFSLSHPQKYRTPRWGLGQINQALFDLESVFDIKHEFADTQESISKSCLVRVDETKFKRLMSEFNLNITNRISNRNTH